MASTVRIDDRAHATLVEIAAEERRPLGQMVAIAIDEYRKQKFWKGVADDFARLKADPVAWKDYQAEVAMWDGLTGDGLAHEEPYYTADEEATIDGDDAGTRGR